MNLVFSISPQSIKSGAYAKTIADYRAKSGGSFAPFSSAFAQVTVDDKASFPDVIDTLLDYDIRPFVGDLHGFLNDNRLHADPYTLIVRGDTYATSLVSVAGAVQVLATNKDVLAIELPTIIPNFGDRIGSFIKCDSFSFQPSVLRTRDLWIAGQGAAALAHSNPTASQEVLFNHALSTLTSHPLRFLRLAT